jgi:hypothetical protein
MVMLTVLQFVVGSGTTRAQDAAGAKTVKSGDTTALVTGSTAPIAVTTTTTRGKTSISETSTTPKQFTLLYTAPATDTAFTEVVTFTNPEQHTVSVTVVPGNSALYEHAFKSLFVLFVLALLLESGLALIFRWRPFLVYFDGRGTKTVVSLAFAVLFVWSFEMDIVTDLVNVYSGRTPPFPRGLEGYLVTAMIVAGGSAAVNNILVALGFRSQVTAAQVTPKPPLTVGWISVTLDRKNAKGPVVVTIGPPPSAPQKHAPVAGTIVGGGRLSKFASFFIRDARRFPGSAGFPVPVGSICQVQLVGVDGNNAEIVSRVWGPETIAPGAIIDLEMTL